MDYSILTINPGSVSTKLGFYCNTTEIITETITHSNSDLAHYQLTIDQFAYRLEKIMCFLQKHNIPLTNLAAVVGRGGLLKPLLSGSYLINELMLTDLKNSRYGDHAANLGAILAKHIAIQANCPAYIVDPVVVDELDQLARFTGRPEISRRSIFHALNQKAVAKRFAKNINKDYHQLNLIIAHLGGGFSIGCHRQGLVVEVSNALEGEGPFSPERSGGLPALQFSSLIFEQNFKKEDIPKLLAGTGGLVAYLGTKDVREIVARINNGDKKAEIIFDAMIYNIARAIAAAAIPVCGQVDHIILTGGLAHAELLTDKIKEYVQFIAPVVVIPGEDELQALAEGAYRVLIGEEKALIYK